jgi:hypothetical protein
MASDADEASDQLEAESDAASEAKRNEARAAAVVAGQRQQLPLGVRNAALAVPDAGGQPEDVLLYFGIIDILQVHPPVHPHVLPLLHCQVC